MSTPPTGDAAARPTADAINAAIRELTAGRTTWTAAELRELAALQAAWRRAVAREAALAA